MRICLDILQERHHNRPDSEEISEAMESPQIFVDERIARICEQVEATHLRQQAEMCTQIYPERQILMQSAMQGGTLIRTLAQFDGKLNRVIGCAKDAAIGEGDLKELKSIYAAIGVKPQIHMSPFARAYDRNVLLTQGYIEDKVLSTYWYDIRKWPTESTSDGPQDVVVRPAEPQEAEQFITASVAGFQDKGRDADLLRLLAELAIQRRDTLYFALINGGIAGTAAMAVMDTPEGRAAHFYLDSTIPQYRGRGVHRALIRARLRAAHQLGVCLVTDITTLGDGSARNAERAGFTLAYTTPVLTALP